MTTLTHAVPTWYEPEATEFQLRVLDEIAGLGPAELAAHVEALDRRQARHLAHDCLNLYPGTNLLSPRVAARLSSSVATRASEGHPGAKYQTGLRWVEEIEVIAAELIRRVFRAGFAEVRAVSGSMANMAVLNSLTEPGDTLFSLPTAAGGHISHNKAGAAGYRRLDIRPIPYDARGWAIDLDALRREARAHPPRLIIVGASLILFPYPLREVRAIADEAGAWVLYDAAHVAGLVAGGAWQHPLAEGAHVMTASTYKSFGGPPGGIVVTDDPDLAKRFDRAVFPGMTANFHTNRLAALAVAAAEMLVFGGDYARDCACNARALAAALDAAGLNVCGKAQGFTGGHMLALDVSQPGGAPGGGRAASLALEAAHIICNKNLLPWDPPRAVRDPSGLRLAVHELTRWGMGPDEMTEVGALYGEVLVERRSPEAVRAQAQALKARFDVPRYCFDPED